MHNNAPPKRRIPTPEEVISQLGTEYVVVGKSRMHMAYAGLTLALLFGVAIGVGYIAGNTNNFSSSQAATSDCDADYSLAIAACQKNFTGDSSDYFACMDAAAINNDVCKGAY